MNTTPPRASQEAVSEERLAELIYLREQMIKISGGDSFDGLDTLDAFRELQRSRLLLAQLRDDLQAAQCAEAMALDDVKALRLLLAAVREAVPALNAGADCIEAFMLRNNDVEVPTVEFRHHGMNNAAALRKIVAEMGE